MRDLIDQLNTKACPWCKTVGRLLAGPGYDRRRIRCQQCGKLFRLGS